MRAVGHGAGRRPTLGDAWTALAIGLPAFVGLASVASIDLAWAVRAGQLTLESRAIPTADPFTFTVPGAPWLNQQWAAQITFALVHGAGGWPALVLLAGVLHGIVAALLLGSCRLVGATVAQAASLTIAGLAIAVPNLAPRPQLLAVVCFAAVQLVLLDRARHPARLAAIPLVAVAWANLHGSAPLAPALVAVGTFEARRRGEPVRPLVGIALATALACLVTPWGTGIVGYAVGIGTSPLIRDVVAEWQPPVPWAMPGMAFWAGVAAMSILVVARVRRRGRRATPPDVPSAPFGLPTFLWLAGLALLGATAVRAGLWFSLAAVPVAAALLADLRAPSAPARRPGERPLAAAIVVGVGLLVVLALPAGPVRSVGGDPLVDDVPVPEATAIAASLTSGDRLFVSQPWASWFELAAPGVPVFLDSRIELFPDAVVADYRTILAGGPDALAALGRWGVTAVVVRPDEGLAATLRTDPRWRLVHDDARVVAFRAQTGVVTQ